MLYKIKAIKYNGSAGSYGEDRVEEDYVKRIGRIIRFSIKYIEPGYPMYCRYEYDSDGTPYKSGSWLRTSTVKKVNVIQTGDLTIEVHVITLNSIFIFEEYPRMLYKDGEKNESDD